MKILFTLTLLLATGTLAQAADPIPVIAGHGAGFCDLQQSAAGGFYSDQCNSQVGLTPSYSLLEGPVSTASLQGKQAVSLGSVGAAGTVLANMAAWSKFNAQANQYMKVQLDNFQSKNLEVAEGLRKITSDAKTNWTGTGRSELAAFRASQESKLGPALKAASAAGKMADSAASAAGANGKASPYNAAERLAALDGTSKTALAAEIQRALPSKSAAAAGLPSFGGLLPEAASANPYEEEARQEQAKWQPLHADPFPANQRLKAAQKFASYGQAEYADEMLNEARALRYQAQGDLSTVNPELADDQKPLFPRVQKFEEQQASISNMLGSLGARVERGEAGKISLQTEKDSLAIAKSLSATAESTFYKGDLERAVQIQTASREVTSIALDFIPGVNFGKSFVELVSGHNYVTGRDLSRGERILAGISVVTLGAESYIKGAGSLAIEGAKAVDASEGARSLVPMVTGVLQEAKAVTQSFNNDQMASRFITNLGTFLLENPEMAKGIDLTEEGLKEIGKRYVILTEKISGLVPKSASVTMVRAIPEEFKLASGEVIKNTEAEVFKVHTGMRSSMGRFSLGGSYGNSALYAVVLEKPELYEDAMQLAVREAGINGTSIEGQTTVAFKKLLDISSNVSASSIGLSLGELTVNKGNVLEQYLLPNMAGDIAKHLGYDAILARSAVNENFTNIISLLEF